MLFLAPLFPLFVIMSVRSTIRPNVSLSAVNATVQYVLFLRLSLIYTDRLGADSGEALCRHRVATAESERGQSEDKSHGEVSVRADQKQATKPTSTSQ